MSPRARRKISEEQGGPRRRTANRTTSAPLRRESNSFDALSLQIERSKPKRRLLTGENAAVLNSTWQQTTTSHYRFRCNSGGLVQAKPVWLCRIRRGG